MAVCPVAACLMRGTEKVTSHASSGLHRFDLDHADHGQDPPTVSVALLCQKRHLEDSVTARSENAPEEPLQIFSSLDARVSYPPCRIGRGSVRISSPPAGKRRLLSLYAADAI